HAVWVESVGMKRSSWLESLAERAKDARAFTLPMRQALSSLDDMLFGIWDLGHNIILAWTRQGCEYRFLAVRHYMILEPFGKNASTDDFPGDFINGILAGHKLVSAADFDRIRGILGAASQMFREILPANALPGDEMVTRLVMRY